MEYQTQTEAKEKYNYHLSSFLSGYSPKNVCDEKIRNRLLKLKFWNLYIVKNPATHN